MSDEERAPLFIPRPEPDEIEKAVAVIFGPIAQEARLDGFTLRRRADKVVVDEDRTLNDLTDAEARELLSTAAKVTANHLEEIEANPDRLLDPAHNPFILGRDPD